MTVLGVRVCSVLSDSVLTVIYTRSIYNVMLIMFCIIKVDVFPTKQTFVYVSTYCGLTQVFIFK